MFTLRCLHPPSGAVALTAVLGGPAVASLGYGFVLWPVALNSVILLSIAVAFNGALRRNYPRRHAEPATSHLTRDPAPSARLGFSRADLDQALSQRGELLDISKEDLEDIVMEAELRASVRRFGDVRCADIMSRDLVSVQQNDPLDYAIRLYGKHRLQTLPVLDAAGRYAGMIDQADVLARKARLAPVHEGRTCWSWIACARMGLSPRRNCRPWSLPVPWRTACIACRCWTRTACCAAW